MQLRVCAVKVVNIARMTHMSLPNIVFVLQLIYCVAKVVNIARATSRTRGLQTLRLNGFRIVTYGKTNSAINRN